MDGEPVDLLPEWRHEAGRAAAAGQPGEQRGPGKPREQ